MFISSCSQEDSNPMFETNSETHINNLESKALPSVLVTIWIRKQVSFGQYVAITGDGAELGNWKMLVTVRQNANKKINFFITLLCFLVVNRPKV